MNVETLPAPVADRAGGYRIDPYVCEDHPDIAFCGLDVSDEPWLSPEPGPNDCVVCLDLLGHCKECGT